MVFKIILVLNISFISFASLFGEENAALWKIVGLETQSLAEITSMLEIQSKHMKAAVKAYDYADQKIEKAEYANYLINRTANIKEELDREKSITATRNNLRLGKSIGEDYVDAADIESLEDNIINTQDSRSKKGAKRDSALSNEFRNTIKKNQSLANSQERSLRVQSHTADIVNDMSKEARNYHMLSIMYAKERRVREHRENFDLLVFLGAVPKTYKFNMYLRDLKKRGQF